MGTKESLLELLEQNTDRFVSGSDAADMLGVSGTAIWKAARKLQGEGYSIEAVNNRGYRLRRNNGLSERDIRNAVEAIRGGSSGYPIEVLDTTDSTNNICRERAAEGAPDGYAAIAGHQTAGRGRRGRSFWSPEGSGLYMSILLRPDDISAAEALRFTTKAAVAVCQAVEAVSGEKAYIKWVNDICVRDRKVCGILTEASFDIESGVLEYAVVGIGINVWPPAGGFPEDIKDKAGAVFSEEYSGKVFTEGVRNRLAAEVLCRFLDYYRLDLPYTDEYRMRSCVVGKKVDVLRTGREPKPALVLGIDDDCHLLVRYENGEEASLDSGEISITHSRPNS